MKNWTKEEILDLLKRNDLAVAKGCVRLFERQVRDEQVSEDTHYTNGRGFNKPDARFMSSIAKWYMKNGKLTPKQVFSARRRILKYAGQLAEIANENSHPIPTRTVVPVVHAEHIPHEISAGNPMMFMEQNAQNRLSFSIEHSDTGWRIGDWPRSFRLVAVGGKLMTIFHLHKYDMYGPEHEQELAGVFYMPEDKEHFAKSLIIND